MWKVFIMLLTKLCCHHQWEEHSVENIFTDDDEKHPYKKVTTLICKKCGKVKQLTTELRCNHNWVCVHTNSVYREETDRLPYKVEKTYMCSKCGEFKQISV